MAAQHWTARETRAEAKGVLTPFHDALQKDLPLDWSTPMYHTQGQGHPEQHGLALGCWDSVLPPGKDAGRLIKR